MLAPADPAAEDIAAVVFDMGGVFLIPDLVTIAAMVATVGIALDPDPDTAHRAHSHGIRAITRLHESSQVDETDPAMWRFYDLAYFSSAGVVGDDLERAVAARDAARRERPKVGHVWTHRLVDNIKAFAAIAEIRPVAIVSNNDGTAADQCRDAGICQVGEGPHTSVAAIVDSGVLGVAKPDPRIFEPALDALGRDPASTLYVGDTVHADVRGANAAGLAVVQLDPHNLHADYSHWRLPDVRALASQLGSAPG